jgi:hypothetical protein
MTSVRVLIIYQKEELDQEEPRSAGSTTFILEMVYQPNRKKGDETEVTDQTTQFLK